MFFAVDSSTKKAFSADKIYLFAGFLRRHTLLHAILQLHRTVVNLVSRMIHIYIHAEVKLSEKQRATIFLIYFFMNY